MKKIMSLLLVLSLVLGMACMASAATTGVLTDGSNTIELPWDTREASVYTYTATQTGTLYIAATDFDYSSGDFVYEDNTENWDEWTMYTELTVDGQTLQGGYYGSVEVVEGQTYTFSWAHGADVANEKWYKLGWRAELDLRYTDELVPKAGSEEMPVNLYPSQCPTDSVQIAAGEMAYYVLWGFQDMTLEVYGEDVYVLVFNNSMNMEGEEFTVHRPKDGVISLPVQNDRFRLCIGNNGEEEKTFRLDYSIPQGTYSNPAQLQMGENVAVCVRDDFVGYHFTWTAACDGTLTLTLPEAGWLCMIRSTGGVDIFSTYADPGVSNPVVVEVKKGDVVSINVDTFEAATFRDPDGELVLTAAVYYDHNYEDGKCTDCGEEEKQMQLGDVNGDGRVNARDARTLLRYIAGLEEGQIDETIADFNKDGRVNARDARALLRYIAGLD